MASPAERYSAARRRSKPSPELAAFTELYDFPLDEFQVQACLALAEDSDVLVAAPTGSGKTVIGEFAVHLARARGRKAFYTTPIKALSNQKYRDFAATYGVDEVGLLTGDVSVNGHADTVIMTTEVLRNMLYEGSSDLADLAFVVLDEVHYLADRERGAVWEELIIQLPDSVTIVALSATVSNVEEFGSWISTVRGDTRVIVEEHRPVPLWQQVMVKDRLVDLFVDDAQEVVNPELRQLSRDAGRAEKHGGRHRPQQGGKRHRLPASASRIDVVDRLRSAHLLPAIWFIFSRAGTQQAVDRLAAAGVRLTSADEREQIRSIVHTRCDRIPHADLYAVDYNGFVDAVERGYAAHNAGMLPLFKEVVEELFQEALLKVVFATETLALGINMPARTVVLERLVKWNGQTHAQITAGEYTQLTGRAGRRGIDVEGNAVVLWSPALQPEVLAGLASTRTYPLRSSFRPTYNMAVNLMRRMDRATARDVLETSFAQYQSDQAVVGLATQIKRNEQVLAGYRESMACHLGDFSEYAAIRAELSALEKQSSRENHSQARADAAKFLEGLRVGDVITLTSGRRAGLAVVVDVDEHAHGDRRPRAMTQDRQVRRLTVTDFPTPGRVVDRLKVKGFHARSANDRRLLAARLADVVARHREVRSPKRRNQDNDVEIQRLRARLRKHPCHGCDDREIHARWGERSARLQRETEGLQRRVDNRSNTIARRFDQVCAVLLHLGYLAQDGQDYTVTKAGRMLSRLYSERSLVLGEVLRTGLWDDLSAPEMAACAAALVYTSRLEQDEPPRLPHGRVGDVLAEHVRIWADIEGLESEHKVDKTPEPDLGFCWAAFAWANGKALGPVLEGSDMTAGDFVRWCKQAIDLLGQVGSAVPPDSPVRATAAACVSAMRRGVVAYSSEV